MVASAYARPPDGRFTSTPFSNGASRRGQIVAPTAQPQLPRDKVRRAMRNGRIRPILPEPLEPRPAPIRAQSKSPRAASSARRRGQAACGCRSPGCRWGRPLCRARAGANSRQCSCGGCHKATFVSTVVVFAQAEHSGQGCGEGTVALPQEARVRVGARREQQPRRLPTSGALRSGCRVASTPRTAGAPN